MHFIHCLTRSNLEGKSGDELVLAIANHKIPDGELRNEGRFLSAAGKGLVVIGFIIFAISLPLNGFPKPQNLTLGLVLLWGLASLPRYVIWRMELLLMKHGVVTSYLDRERNHPINSPNISLKDLPRQAICTILHVIYLLLFALLCTGVVNWSIKGFVWLSS